MSDGGPVASLPVPPEATTTTMDLDTLAMAIEELTNDPGAPCGLWAGALDTLLAGESFADQTVAVERWLESVHTNPDSTVVGLPLVDFQLATVALAAVEWDFSAVDDLVLLAWVEGFLGDTLFGVGQVPVPRDDCVTDLHGPEAAAVSIDCVVRLEGGFRWLMELDRDPTAALSEAEADALAVGVARRWIEAGASPLCLSQVLGSVPVEDMERHLDGLATEEANQVAAAGAAMAEGLDHLDYWSNARPLEAEGVIG